MASSALATAFVNIVPGTTAVENYLKTGLGNQAAGAGQAAGGGMAQGLAGGFGSKIKGYLAPVLGTMAATFAAVQVKDFLKDSITNASDFNEQGAAVGQVFGKAAAAIQTFAAGSAVSLGQSKTQVLEAAKQFGIYGKAAGLAGTDNANFSTGMVKLATDLASFNNTSVDEAILAIGSGLRGEAEPLRKFGVLLDDATLRAQALEMGLIKTTKTALTPQQKVLAAHAVIMKQTSTQQGDFERTSGGLANQQRILAAQTENFQIALGTKLMPAMSALVSFANTNMIPALYAIGNFFKDYGAPIAAFVGTIALLTLALNAQAIAIAITTSATWAWTAALLANPITWIVLGVAALVAGIVLLATKTTFFQDAWAAMTKFAVDAWNTVVGGVAAFGDWISKNWKTIISWILFPMLNVIQLIINNWDKITAFFSTLWNNVLSFFGTVWNRMVTGAKIAIANVVNFFAALPGQVITFLQALPGKVIALFAGAGKWLFEAGKNVVQGLMNGVKSLLPSIGNFFLDLLPAFIREPFKKALGIRSPSKVFAGFGKNIIQGLHKGLMSEKTSVVDAMQKVSDWVTNAFNDKKITAKQKKAATALISAYSKQLSALEAKHTVVMENLDAAQKTLADKIQERAEYISNLAEKFGSALTIDTSVADQTDIANAKNDVAKAQEKYNELLKDTKASITDIEDARLSLASAEKKLVGVQSPGTTAAKAIAELKAKVAKTQELQKVTDQLQGMGLNKSLYKNIVESGAVDFAKSIIEGGAAAVNELNVLSDQADKAALELASKVGDTLYTQGIQFAQSVVDGLKSQEAALTAVMDAVASAFEAQISKVVQGNLNAINSAIAGANAQAAKAVTTATKAVAKKAAPVATKAPTAVATVSKTTKMIAMASGGFVTGPTPALVGEAGPEVVTPLKDFERMVGLNDNNGPTVIYNAAPNQSLDAEQALFQAMKRAKVVGAW